MLRNATDFDGRGDIHTALSSMDSANDNGSLRDSDLRDVVCFSCGKSGHTATPCPNLNEAFPFLQPGWRTEKTLGGFAMIPPWGTTDRRRAENDG